MPYIDLAARLYLAYMLVEYGLAKLTGGMFCNTPPTVLQAPLKDASLFHLTWYFFQRQVALSYFVGLVQIVSAILLVVNRTVLIGVLLAFPVLLNIAIIDFSSLPTPHLGIRTLFYNLLLVGFCICRKDQVKVIWTALTRKRRKMGSNSKIAQMGLVLLFAGLLFILEVLLMKLGALLSGA